MGPSFDFSKCHVEKLCHGASCLYAVTSANVSLMAFGSAGAVSAQSKDNDVRVESNKKWKFDSNRHDRRRNKDDRFRFHFGGFWYPQPYWLGYGWAVNPRIAAVKAEPSLMHVGSTGSVRWNAVVRPTYFGRRHGDSFKVMVSARTGRIVDVDRV